MASLKTWLQLARFPLVFTVFGNLLAADATLPLRPWWRLALTMVCGGAAYLAGMILNDVADLARDRSLHPERPLPNGKLSRPAAARLGAMLLVAAGACAFGLGGLRTVAGLLLCVAVLTYDFGLKRWRLPGAIAMAACRGLVVLTVLAGTAAWPFAGIVTAYTLLLTLLSTFEEGEGRAGPVGLVFSLLLLGALGALSWWGSSAAAAVVWGLLGLSFAAEAWRQRASPRPKGVGLMVRHLLFGFIALDAGLALAAGSPAHALAIVALLVPIFGSRALLR